MIIVMLARIKNCDEGYEVNANGDMVALIRSVIIMIIVTLTDNEYYDDNDNDADDSDAQKKDTDNVKNDNSFRIFTVL